MYRVTVGFPYQKLVIDITEPIAGSALKKPFHVTNAEVRLMQTKNIRSPLLLVFFFA